MSLGLQPPSSDLVLPLPGAGQTWDPYTVHTHYFGFSVPEARIGAFLYIRYQPAFPLSQGGVCIFRGFDNYSPVDIDHQDYQITMPWPTIEDNKITTANGLSIEFVEPGKIARLTYDAGDTSFDITQTAITPLLARGHVVPGEEAHHNDPGAEPGGSEQFMHAVGTLTLNGERHDVDCYAVRDRSWRQIRKEPRGGAAPVPPVGWSPMCFGEDLIFNQISFEAPDTDPTWSGVYDLPPDVRTHHFAWLQQGDKTLDIVRVRRNVLEQQPITFATLRQEIEAEDSTGAIHRFSGEAIATAVLPAWPNASFHDSVFRWTDSSGRIAHSTYQELWSDRYQRGRKARATTNS
jgi:hypothetical protein